MPHSPAPRFPPELAFVVQLQGPAHPAPDDLAGRVEHIASGHAARFASLAELQHFMGATAQLSEPNLARSRK